MTKNTLKGLNESQSNFVSNVVNSPEVYGYVANLFFMSKDIRDKIISYIGQSLLDSVVSNGDVDDFLKQIQTKDYEKNYGFSQEFAKFILTHQG